MKNYVITAESSPDYDDWGWDDYWSARDWMTWHRRMKEEYGKEKANIRFLTAWEKQSSLSSPLDTRTFDADFKRYAKDNGFYEGLFDPGILKLILKGISLGLDVTEATIEAVDETAGTLPAIGKIIKYGVPIILIALILGTGWWAYKNFIAVKND